jgi:hypothetical protein
MFAWWTCLQTVCNRRGKNGAKIGLSVVKSAEDGICHRPMLYQLSYAHHTLIGNSLTLFFSGCFCLHVCNRRQLSDFIRMELRSSMCIYSNHSVTTVAYPEANHRK